MLSDQEFLLKHARNPSHSGDPSLHAHQGSCRNPICGDAVDIGVSVENDLIAQIHMRASGCAISTASASLMSEVVKGRSVMEALGLLDQFNATLLESPTSMWPDELSQLKPFARLRESPTRVPCALIGWFAFKDAVVKSTSP